MATKTIRAIPMHKLCQKCMRGKLTTSAMKGTSKQVGEFRWLGLHACDRCGDKEWKYLPYLGVEE